MDNAFGRLFGAQEGGMLNPDGRVTQLMAGDYSGEKAAAAAKIAEEEEKERLRLEAIAQEKALMEQAAAAAAADPNRHKVSKWNPMRLLFGQPDGSESGILN